MRWEYKIIEVWTIDALEKINALGSEGWELVAVEGTAFYFKRAYT